MRRLALLPVLFLGTVATSSVLDAQPLFADDSLVHVTIDTDVRALRRVRDSTKVEWHAAQLRIARGDSVERIDAEVRARGHFRRQARNCDFPPVMLRVGSDARRGTLLQGNRQVKLVIPCRPGREEYERYIRFEHTAYRLYAEVMEVHPRSRRARFTWRDSARSDSLVVDGFFLETDDEVARHYDLALRDELLGATFADLDAPTLDRLSLFALLVGNTDWSVSAQHNVYLLQDTATGRMVPVGYDWDWTGFVNPRYAFPNAALGIKRVTDRLHRGPCRTREAWAPTIAHFKAKRPAIEAIIRETAGASERDVEAATKFVADFWELLDNERRFQREVEDQCLVVRN